MDLWNASLLVSFGSVLIALVALGYPISLWRGNLWQCHEPQIVGRVRSTSVLVAVRPRVLPACAEALGLLHHYRRQLSWARAVHVVLAQGVSELMIARWHSLPSCQSTVREASVVDAAVCPMCAPTTS